MSIHARRTECKLLFTALLFAAGLASPSRGVVADDSTSPSPQEKRAVATLAEKGSVIFIDGAYQVTQILGGRDLTNDDLQHLKTFKKLKSLSLSNAKINDAGLETLKSLSQLQSLNLPAGALSDQAREELRKALPNCRIVQPDRRGFGSGPSQPTGSPLGSVGSQEAWGAFEFPPMIPAPSILAEIRLPEVQERLKLTAEQKQEIERVTGRDYQRRQTEDAIKKVLTNEQNALIQQVLLQREGPTALILPDVAKKLKLSDEQREAVQKIMDDRREQLMAIGDQLRNRTIEFSTSIKETSRINGEANKKLLGVLTDQQRQNWDRMIGPPLPPPRFTGFGGNRTPEESARSVFRNLDRDSDGLLTAEEWRRSRSTRTRFENAKVTLEFPINVEDFVKRYLQLDASVKSQR